MRLKPSMRWTKVRSAVALGVAVAGFSTLAVAQTTPAMADPTETLVVVGSDTIQDVWNAFATSFGGNLVGSYNATNPVDGAINEVITPVDGTAGVNCSFARPNGSGQGVAALRLALNASSTNASAAATPVPQVGCVDIARSSSGPGTLGNYTGTGGIQYVPFALDAVGGATGPATASTTAFNADLGNGTTQSVTPEATVITTADSFTLTDLETLYASCGTVTEGGVTYWPQGSTTAQPSGSVVIDLYVPQSGSGTRSFWASTLGFSATTLPACVHDHIIAGELAPANTTGNVSVPVEQDDGSVFATDPNGFGPFSIAQWVSQNNGHNDRRHGAVIHSLNAISPFTTSGTLNTSFPITRDVYDVVSLTRLTTSGDPLNTLLDGSTSKICNAKSTILSYGFALIGSTCGAILAADEAAP